MTTSQLLTLLAIGWIATGLGRFLLVVVKTAMYALAELYNSSQFTVCVALMMFAVESILKGPLFTRKLKDERWKA